MRFIYGFIMGVLVTIISAILYLAFASGDYVLQLSPHYHEMTSTIASLKEAKEQRDQLAARLDTLANGFEQLTRRFNELTGDDAGARSSRPGSAGRGSPIGGGAASAGSLRIDTFGSGRALKSQPNATAPGEAQFGSKGRGLHEGAE